jgi:hypothetical protein
LSPSMDSSIPTNSLPYVLQSCELES